MGRSPPDPPKGPGASRAPSPHFLSWDAFNTQARRLCGKQTNNTNTDPRERARRKLQNDTPEMNDGANILARKMSVQRGHHLYYFARRQNNFQNGESWPTREAEQKQQQGEVRRSPVTLGIHTTISKLPCRMGFEVVPAL